MSEIPEVFAIFEQKLAHALSFTVVPLKSKDLKNALEEILTYFSGIVERASKAESRIAELSQAVGLITTLKPTMVMDANHPLDMVREVAEHVTARITNLEAANRGWCEQYSHELNENIALQSRIAELEEERRWIPVSERLPDTKILYDKFDVIVGLGDIGDGEKIRRVALLFYDYRNKSWNDDCGEFGFYPVTGITHWRERPTPPEYPNDTQTQTFVYGKEDSEVQE